MTADKILDPLRKPTEHSDECRREWIIGCCCRVGALGPAWIECEDAIAEVEALRAVVRAVVKNLDPHMDGKSMPVVASRALTSEQADAVRRALEAQP